MREGDYVFSTWRAPSKRCRPRQRVALTAKRPKGNREKRSGFDENFPVGNVGFEDYAREKMRCEGKVADKQESREEMGVREKESETKTITTTKSESESETTE